MTRDHATLIANLNKPHGPQDDYGTYRCGCTWDSGPYTVPCRDHDRDNVISTLTGSLIEAVEANDLEAARTVAGLLRKAIHWQETT